MPEWLPARRNILKLLGFLMLVAAIILGIRAQRNSSGSRHIRSGADAENSFGNLQGTPHLPKASRRPKSASYGRDCDAWFAEVLARNPGLEPQWRSVADEDNGFLKLLDFAERHRPPGKLGDEELGLSEDLLAFIRGSKEWDHESVAAALAGHQDLLNEITRIGLMPEQSAADVSIDRFSFVGARLYKQCGDLLLADARLAAERGDAERSLQRIRATLGIARHWTEIETPSILMGTVATLVRLGVDAQVTQHILPALDLDHGALAEWQLELNDQGQGPGDLAELLRGEAYVSIRGMAIPLLARDDPGLSKHDIPDPDAFIDATVARLLGLASQVEDATMGSLATSLTPDSVETPEHLSPGARDAYEAFYIGTAGWSTGWTRAVSIHARTDAALAIMAGTEPPVEPITSLPFVFDPETRALSHPDDPRLEKIESDPITVP